MVGPFPKAHTAGVKEYYFECTAVQANALKS